MTLPRDNTLDEKAELNLYTNKALPTQAKETRAHPLSPKTLAPLVIPPSTSALPRLTRQLSLSRLRSRSGSGGTPTEGLRSARTDDSPKAKTPFTPLSASLTTPKSAATTTMSVMTASTLPTPISAPIESRSSPNPWDKGANYGMVTTPRETTAPSEASITPRADPILEQRSASAVGHRRNHSESGSIMERGRPRKRSETSGSVGAGAGAGTALRRTGSRRSKSADRRAFEQLPKGWKASDAATMLTQAESDLLRKQALQQAARFEVLRKEDVDNLSRVSFLFLFFFFFHVQTRFHGYAMICSRTLGRATNQSIFDSCRNSANSTSALSTCVAHTLRCARVDATCTPASASTCARRARPSSATSRC
jgi:hypothetical protein